MKIFMISGGVPHRNDDLKGITGFHIQMYEWLKAVTSMGHEVILQIIFFESHENYLLPFEKEALKHLETLGVEVYLPIYPKGYIGKNGYGYFKKLVRAIRVLRGEVAIHDFYPSKKLGNRIRKRVREVGADVIFLFLSPQGVAATHGFHEVPKIAFHGDLDFRPHEVRITEETLFYGNGHKPDQKIVERTLDTVNKRIWLKGYKRAFPKLMLDVDTIANDNAANLSYYRKIGHSRAIYVGPFWKDLAFLRLKKTNTEKNNTAGKKKIKIIGHVGFLNRTGSTYGLRYLLRDLAPVLEKEMKGLDYEVHIIGGGNIAPGLKPLLRQSRIIQRGWVKDLYGELRSSHIFLLLNNSNDGRYWGGFSRHVIPWSLGLCLITHENSQKTILQLHNNENALIGSRLEEIAQKIYLAATDQRLRERICKGGRRTFEEHFSPDQWTKKIVNEMERLVV